MTDKKPTRVSNAVGFDFFWRASRFAGDSACFVRANVLYSKFVVRFQCVVLAYFHHYDLNDI